MATSETSDKRPDWLKRKHSKQRRDTYCALIRDALADGKPRTISTATGDDGTERPIGSHDEALAVKNLLYTCNRYMQETSIPKPDIAQRADGTWEIQFTVRSKAEGRAHIAAKPRSEWAYDTQPQAPPGSAAAAILAWWKH